jgi:DNA-directed RNA polymerase III subunit RPC2
MVYPQKPMVKSRTLDLVNFDQLPGGQNASLVRFVCEDDL